MVFNLFAATASVQQINHVLNYKITETKIRKQASILNIYQSRFSSHSSIRQSGYTPWPKHTPSERQLMRLLLILWGSADKCWTFIQLLLWHKCETCSVKLLSTLWNKQKLRRWAYALLYTPLLTVYFSLPYPCLLMWPLNKQHWPLSCNFDNSSNLNCSFALKLASMLLKDKFNTIFGWPT